MQKKHIQFPETSLIGVQVRTNFNQEMQTSDGLIGPTVAQYMSEKLFDSIPNRLQPGVTYSAYTDYDGDYRGAYTYFIGEAVTSHADIPDGFSTLTLPKGTYTKFTSEKGVMPNICIELWQSIWEIESKQYELGGKRRYHTDFEVYDERAIDPSATILDIYIGLKE